MTCGGEGFDDGHGVGLFFLVECDEVEELAEDDGAELGMCLLDVVGVDGVGGCARENTPAVGLERCLSC